MIAIDLGGTKIAAAVVQKGHIVQRVQVPTGARKGKRHVLTQLRTVLDTLGPGTVGIGVPGSFNGSTITSLVNIPCLNGVNLQKTLDRKVKIQNDATCFALGELVYGAARGKNTIVGVTLGTGLGSGILIDKRPYRGIRCLAGELGHQRAPDGKTSWENLLSGKAIIKRHKARGGTEQRASDIWTSTSVKSKATQKETARYLAIFCANIVLGYDPDCIVIGGGAATRKLVQDANALMPTYNARKILKMSTLGVDTGILGASLL